MKYLLTSLSLSALLLFSLTQIVFAQDSTISLTEEENANNTATLISLLKAERFEEAMPYVDKILEINPNHTASLLNKGSILIKLDRSDESITYFDRLLKIEPNNIKGLSSKAAALSNIGETQRALDLYDKILSMEKNDEKILCEIKGTTGSNSRVILTRNEVLASKKNYPYGALFIVSGIFLNRSKKPPEASLGKLTELHNWKAEDEKLTPISYYYNL